MPKIYSYATNNNNYKQQYMDCTNIFKFGELMLLKHQDWFINFRCKYCDRQTQKLDIFLNHALSHILAIEKEKVPMLIAGVLTEEAACIEPEIAKANIKLVEKIKNICGNTKEKELSLSGEQIVNGIVEKENNHEKVIMPARVEKNTMTDDIYKLINQDLEINCIPNVSVENLNATQLGFEIEVFDDFDTQTTKTVTRYRRKSNQNNNLSRKNKQQQQTYQCTQCDKYFLKQKYLKVHLITHSTDKPYVCDICDAKFGSASNYKVHRNRHLGIKPYCCVDCNKGFTTSTDLQAHMRSHTDARPFICDICGITYKSQKEINKHIKNKHIGERNFVCHICNKKFFDRETLNDHKLGHEDLRRFACEECGKLFKRRKALVQHAKLHSDVYEYECELCCKAFQQRPGLNSHLKKVHKITMKK